MQRISVIAGFALASLLTTQAQAVTDHFECRVRETGYSSVYREVSYPQNVERRANPLSPGNQSGSFAIEHPFEANGVKAVFKVTYDIRRELKPESELGEWAQGTSGEAAIVKTDGTVGGIHLVGPESIKVAQDDAGMPAFDAFAGPLYQTAYADDGDSNWGASLRCRFVSTTP
jgi:hypothetical protein